jgi:hypothetical protein
VYGLVAYDVFFLCDIQMMVHYGWMDGSMYGLKPVWVLPLKTFDINHDQTKGSFVWLWGIEKEIDSVSK